jgi:hypothetical protein
MVTPQDAQNITKDYVKKRKNVEKVDIIAMEKKDEGYLVKGTCPIDVGGHPWMERFEVVIDIKGKVKDSDFKLM